MRETLSARAVRIAPCTSGKARLLDSCAIAETIGTGRITDKGTSRHQKGREKRGNTLRSEVIDLIGSSARVTDKNLAGGSEGGDIRQKKSSGTVQKGKHSWGVGTL